MQATGLRSFITGKPRSRMQHGKGKPRCSQCRLRIRGKKADHEEGEHHKGNRTGRIGR